MFVVFKTYLKKKTLPRNMMFSVHIILSIDCVV